MPNYFAESFPAVLTSGVTLSGEGLSGFVYPSGWFPLYSWQEVVVDGQQGTWSGQVSPRNGVANLREVNNQDVRGLVSGGASYYAMLDYQGNVSGQAFYSFNAGKGPATSGVSVTLSGSVAVFVGCSGALVVTYWKFYEQFVNGILVSGYFGA